MARKQKLGPRITAAREAIEIAGGPAAFASQLSAYLQADVDTKRIEQWRYRGVPDEWSVIVEHLTGVERQRLNPHLYNLQDTHRVIHKKLTDRKSKVSAG